MSSIFRLKVVAGLLTAMVCAGVYAQPASDSAPSSGPAAAGMSAKAQRAENRKLAKSVRHALAKTKGLSSVNITVRAKDGVITLRGSVPDSTQIGLAGEVASGVPGVRSVSNDLTPYRQAQ